MKRMKVKKILAAVLALMMIASLAACGKKADDNNNGDNSLQRVLDAGKLTIGVEGNWIPYVYNDEGTGELTGFEVEVAKEIAKRLGVTAEFNISDSWDPVGRSGRRPLRCGYLRRKPQARASGEVRRVCLLCREPLLPGGER